MTKACRRLGRYQRRAQAVLIMAVSSMMLIGFAAIAVDVGLLYNTKAELQRTADAAALAGAWELVLDENRLKGDAGVAVAVGNSQQVIAAYGHKNPVLNTILGIDPNGQNGPDGDMVFGLVADLSSRSSGLQPCVDSTTNAVSVFARRDSIRNGPVPLWFARIFGKQASNVDARATAAFQGGVRGYRITAATGNADLLPFTLHLSSWEGLIAGTTTIGDSYAYDPETGAVTSGPDGIPELNLYPGAGVDQLPPGNFGTVDIGNSNNSTADLSRQILHGVNADDLDYMGGQLAFAENGTLLLNGDTGLSAGVKDELAAIKGQARAIPIFTTVTGNGNNAQFTTVRFGGIRIMNVKLTGAMSKKELIIQPAIVVDDAAISSSEVVSNYVYAPPVLVH